MTERTRPGDKEHSDKSRGFTRVRDGGRIAQLFRAALEDETLIELQINERTRLFFSLLQDHPPKAEPNELGEMVDPPPYDPLSYIKEKDRLILLPLDPPVGNAQIRTSEIVLLRFFKGVKALEGNVVFQGVERINGQPVLKLSFPTELREYRKRRHFRASITRPEAYIATVSLGSRGEKVAVTPLDISAGGMAFCYPTTGHLTLGDEIVIEIGHAPPPSQEETENGEPPPETPPAPAGASPTPPASQEESLPPLRINAFVRALGKPSPNEKCGESTAERCGAQFDLLDEHLAMEIASFVAHVQRIHLQEKQDKQLSGRQPSRAPARDSATDAPSSNVPLSARLRLGSLLGIKR